MDASLPPSRLSIRVVDVYPYRLTEHGSELLLLRRAPDVSYAGSWRMVGGKIADGETAWQAAQRELLEETGLVPSHFWTLPSLNHFYEWQHDRINMIPAFAAEVDGVPALNHEHDRAEWVSTNEAIERLQWPEQQRLVRLVDAMLISGIPESLVIPTGSESTER